MPKKSSIRSTENETWLNRIKYAEHIRNEADIKFGYSRSLLEYAGDYTTTLPTFMMDTAVVPINEIYGYVKTFIPSVYSRNPHISFNAKGRNAIAPSKVLELLVNSYWRELRLKQQIRRCIFDAIFAEGWFKTGYSAAFGSIEPENEDIPVESNEFIRDEEIFATRISWKHMVKDPDAVDGIHDARWVAQKIIKPLKAVQNSPLYTAKNIVATSTFDLNAFNSKKDRKLPSGEVEEFIEFWEIWDSDHKKIMWISDGCQEDLREREDWPYSFDGYSFDLLRFNQLEDEPYAPNCIYPWEPQLWEKIKIRSMEMDHIKRFNRQLWAKKGSVSKAQMQKFALGHTGAINEYEGDAPPAPAQYPQIQTDIYAVENRIDLDKDNISGQPNAVRSAPQRTQSRTLGEIDRLIGAFQARQVDPQGDVEDFCNEIAIKIAAVAKEYLPGDKFVRVTQQDLMSLKKAFGENRFDGTGFRFSKKDIAGAEFESEVKTGSTLPLDRQGRIEALINILKLGATIGIQPGGKTSMVVGKNIISEFEMKEIETAYEEQIARADNSETLARAALQLKQGALEDKITRTREAIRAGGAGGL